jgi:capsular exopolysaccharide synthesis family protein
MRQLPEATPNDTGRGLAPRPEYADRGSAPVGYGPPEVVEEPASGGLLEYWHILLRRKGTLLLITFLGLLAALLITLPQTPIYQAQTTLEIQGLSENFLNMGDVNPTAPVGSYSPYQDIQTQIKILQSEALVERVVAKFKGDEQSRLVEETDRISAWRKALGLPQPETVSEREAALRMAADNLKVRGSGQTRIIEVLCDSTDAKLAARFANTLTNEFIEQNLEARWQTTERTGEFLARQLEDLKIKLERAEGGLQHYAAATGLMFTSEKENVAEQKLRQLQEELSRAQAERVTRQSRYEMATTSPPESLPDVLDDAALRGYQSKLTDLRRQMAELGSALTVAHPRVKRVQAQVVTLEAALERERGNILKRIHNEYQTALRREKLLARDYSAQSRFVTSQAGKVTHYNILKREADTTRELYQTMLHKVKEAGVASALRASNIRVVDPAKPPRFPYKPRIILNSTLGLMMGLFFGVVFVVMRERADRSIQAPGDAAYCLNVPELGVIPSADARRSKSLAYYYHRKTQNGQAPDGENSKQSVELVTWERKPSMLAESFRATLASILFTTENGDRPRVIVLTSPSPGEGKTTVVSNLGLALAEIHRRVVLIDADLRRARLHDIFHLPNEYGLSDLLQEKKPPHGREALVIGTGYQELYLLPSGTEAASASSLLHSPRMVELVNRLREEFDTVLIDTPPMLHLPDARVLGRLADGVILVVRSTQTTRDTALAASQRLTEDGTKVLGTILNYWDPRKTAGYGYGYGYGYRSYERYYRS